ncbi:MAG: hypothetical protein D3924_16375, partial [Candidatus Electrothrix sp. AR4]|nr:hypothetical protein [Candidatus Electrothrix sp. AR4]
MMQYIGAQQVKNIKLFVGAGVLLVVITVGILVAVAPVILSSDWMRNIVVNKVNSGSPGELALGDCGIGWSEGLECTDVAYKDAAQGYQLDVARLSSTQGLFSLIMAPKNLGIITVDDPVLVVDQPTGDPVSQKTGKAQEVAAQGGNEADGKAETVDKDSESVAADTEEADEKATWFWHKMVGKLLLNRVAVHMKPADKELSVLLSEGFLDAALASDNLNFTLSLQTGAESGAGEVKAAGLVNLPSVKGNLMDLLTADMQLTITDVQTAPF